MNKDKAKRLTDLSLDICMRTLDAIIKDHEDRKEEIIAVYLHMIEAEARRRFDV